MLPVAHIPGKSATSPLLKSPPLLLPLVLIHFLLQGYGSGLVFPLSLYNLVVYYISLFPSSIKNRGDYINDVVGIIVNLLERNNIASKTLNIGTGRQTRIIDLAKKIILLSNSKSKIRLYDSKKDYIIKRCADINLLNRLLERPKLVSLDEGLKNTIKWYRNYNECLNSNSRI